MSSEPPPGAPAVRVAGLSKLYALGTGSSRPRALRETFEELLPWSRRKRDPAEELWAIRDVSFQIPRGEAFGIIGTNGSGKSTLLKILSGITEPTLGEAEIRGRVGSLLEIGSGFHPELTGRENVFLNGTLLGLSAREIADRFDAIIEFSEVARLLDTPVKRYSSGMYLRLAFAVAAHLDTDVLLVDEVLAVGDARFRQKCLARMREIARDGRTIVLVSHDLSAVEELCDRTLILERGQIDWLGPTQEALSRYNEANLDASDRVDLRDHHGRIGSTHVFAEIRLLDADGTGRQSLRQGQALRVEMLAHLESPIEAPEIVLRIRTESARLVAVAGSRTTLPALQGCVLLEGHLGAMELSPGAYRLDVELVDGHAARIDAVEGAMRLLIEPELRRSGVGLRLEERAWVVESRWAAKRAEPNDRE